MIAPAFRAACFGIGLAVLGGCGGEAAGPGLRIENAWSRPAAAGGVGGGYVTLINVSKSPVTLVSIATPLAERVELHQSLEQDGVFSMREFPQGVVIRPGRKLTFRPGGFHAMMIGMKEKTQAGQSVPATLTVRREGGVFTLDVPFSVRVAAPEG